METSIDQEAIYIEYINVEFENRIQTLVESFQKESPISQKRKLQDYIDILRNEFDSFTKKNIGSNQYVTDYFVIELIKQFNLREDEYEENFVQNFLEIKLPKLRADFKSTQNRIVNRKIYEASKMEVLRFLAKYFALEKFLSDSHGMVPKKGDTIDRIINQIRNGKRNNMLDELGIQHFGHNNNSNSSAVSKTQTQIEWLGTQKQLGELFIELERNGWIKEIDVNRIKSSFTKAKTIEQILKPDEDPQTKEKPYPQIYTTKYKRKFDKIKAK
jgi:hypothetical protein